ncbi:winged helix-turn-helix transcriptional regulator [Actinoplanes derwentensis]|uniref:DNA-binding transcriptional regulator, HxlR family n=1 Tax=Actinoplanes derwentensis TaxID=113562 RepID=A0A1H2CX01_9ACTN|nr:helix-turn-helix domain-containing protein [Actinoplanes derwentensis]GID82797.1 transcriptional regulator [Actinoplanes derwentensis]SDT75048.1 DNA-binding transcriptional regulator, HxlR family [Actinoplanes derwentensis]
MTVLDSHSCARRDAALSKAFEFLGRRWNAAILGKLHHGPSGFRDLSRAIDGISDSVLSNRLSSLVAAELIVRTVEDGPPVSVSYALAPAGRALMPALDQIAVWAEDHLSA